jgi:hypothetical protein
MKSRIVLKGGLGDALIALHGRDIMGTIDDLPPGDMIQIVILSPCRGMAELFALHPKRSQLEIVDLEYVDPFTPELLIPYGNLPATKARLKPRQIQRYLTPADRKFLAELPRKFVAFSLSSSHDNRNVPELIAREAAEICARHGFSVILLGRNYEPWHRWGETRWMGKRSEPIITAPNVVNAIDAISLPGALEVLARSSGVFCSLSAFQIAAWLNGKRSYVVTPKEFEPAIKMISGWVVGNLKYSDGHAIVRYAEEWAPDSFSTFVKSIA